MKVNELSPQTRVGHLTLIETIVKNGGQHWKCRCDCGKECIRGNEHLFNVFRKGITTSSCGCHQYDALKGDNNTGWSGCGDLSGQYYASIKCRAKQKSKNRENGIEFNVSIEYLWQLFLDQNAKCAISGLPIALSKSRKTKEARKSQTASLDRIDCNKGYVEGNVQWVHRDINLMRNTMSIELFKKYCKNVVDYNNL